MQAMMIGAGSIGPGGNGGVSRRRGPRGRQSGMTMMELLAVLVIIGIVMGVVGSKFFGQAEEAKRKAAKIEINQIGQSLDLYKLEVGRYPTTSEGLQALITAPSGVSNWNGPYWKNGAAPQDPWKNDYKYTSPGQHGAYDIISMGPDGKEGGEGPDRDITSWDGQ
jgi:general secretion pathway protein G